MTTTETITNNFDHQTSLSPIRRQAPYDLQPKIGHTYVESPSHTRPSSGFQRPSSRQHHEELPPETPSRRPKTTHVSSPRKRWSQIEDAEDSFDAPDVPPSPSIRPMTSIYRRPGQQFSHESSEMMERSRSRNLSRNQDYHDDEDISKPVEVQGFGLASSSPIRRHHNEDIQPKIGHHYSRSPSPPLVQQRSQRPMTSISRSSSRNAMTQVDLRNNSLSTQSTLNLNSGRGSPPNRGYIEITGRESRAERAEMKQSQTTPNLNSYPEYDYNGRRMSHSYSRHFNNDSSNSDQDQPNWSRNRNGSNLKPATSLSLLPLARDAQNLSFRDKYNRPGSDWNLTTSKRSYRFSEEGFKHARAQPYRPSPSLKIAIEGKRYLSPEKREVFVRFANNRPSRSARQDALPTPPMTNPLFGHAPQHVKYDEDVPLQPSTNRQDAGYGRADTGFRSEPPCYSPEIQTTRRRESLNMKPDTRFVQGTTTQSAFREPAPEAFSSEEYRPKPVLPKHNLLVREDKKPSDEEKPPPRPTSAMSESFQPPAQDAYSEKWRPRPIIPPTTLKMEGEMTRKTTSTKEEFPARPYCRQAPTPRLSNLSVSTENLSLQTTYRVNSASVLGSPLKRALRHDPQLRRSDSIDWM